MAWYREEEMFSAQYATLDDYHRIIELSEGNYFSSSHSSGAISLYADDRE